MKSLFLLTCFIVASALSASAQEIPLNELKKVFTMDRRGVTSFYKSKGFEPDGIEILENEKAKAMYKMSTAKDGADALKSTVSLQGESPFQVAIEMTDAQKGKLEEKFYYDNIKLEAKNEAEVDGKKVERKEYRTSQYVYIIESPKEGEGNSRLIVKN